MRVKYLSAMLVSMGIVVLLGMGLWLATAEPVSAQCGSQASSCKNCHEVQGEKAVNNDGTAWHMSHAFGDFCYICHAGNNQAKDIESAHTGMVAPLSDIKASCQQCHVDDLQARAEVYAATLGVEIGAGGPAAPADAPAGEAPAAGAAVVAGATAPISAPPAAEIDLNDPNLVDYVQRYNEIVLGQRPTNWGNTILLLLIGLVLVGGGGFVVYNELLSRLPQGSTRRVEGEYPEDVLAMLPAITRLETKSRQSLKKILEKSPKVETALQLIDTLVSDEKGEGAAR